MPKYNVYLSFNSNNIVEVSLRAPDTATNTGLMELAWSSLDSIVVERAKPRGDGRISRKVNLIYKNQRASVFVNVRSMFADNDAVAIESAYSSLRAPTIRKRSS